MSENSRRVTLFELERWLDSLLEELIGQQRARVSARAQALNPRLTEEDLLQPHDIPELRSDPEWNYEDGVLAGFYASQMAIRASLRSEEFGQERSNSTVEK